MRQCQVDESSNMRAAHVRPVSILLYFPLTSLVAALVISFVTSATSVSVEMGMPRRMSDWGRRGAVNGE